MVYNSRARMKGRRFGNARQYGRKRSEGNKPERKRMDKKELEKLGSTDIITWVRECMGSVEKSFKELRQRIDSLFHIEIQDLDSFKKSIESYAKAHPGADIKATGFMFSSKEPKKSKTYRYKKK